MKFTDGGETTLLPPLGSPIKLGHQCRPSEQAFDWVLDIQEQYEKADVAFFFKQWCGTNKKKPGRMLEGRTWDEMPNLPELYRGRN